jgi:hypothetical protein
VVDNEALAIDKVFRNPFGVQAEVVKPCWRDKDIGNF